MLGKPRLVPSRAALKVLRQLAYISSGTACGTAAVILEEQRRQVHFARQVADNGTRLKQHPRRVHGATQVSEHRGDSGLYALGTDSYLSSRHSSRGRSDSNQDDPHPGYQGRGRDAQLPGSKAPFLPSEVDTGYDKLSQRSEVPRSAHQHPTARAAPSPAPRQTRPPTQSSSLAAQLYPPRQNTSRTAPNVPDAMTAPPLRSLGYSPACQLLNLLASCRHSPHPEIRDLASSLANESIPVQRLELIRVHTRLGNFEDAEALIPTSKVTQRIPQWTNVLGELLTHRFQADQSRAMVMDTYKTIQGRITNRVLKEKLFRHMLGLCTEAQDLAAVVQVLQLVRHESYAMNFHAESLDPLLLQAVLARQWTVVGHFLGTLRPSRHGVSSKTGPAFVLRTLMSELASTADYKHLLEAVDVVYQSCDAGLQTTAATAALSAVIRQGDLSTLGQLLAHLRDRGDQVQITAEQAHGALRHYYMTRRPSALQFKSLIDALRARTPQLVSDQLESLLDAAVAHDLRKLKGIPGRSRVKREGLRKLTTRAYERLSESRDTCKAQQDAVMRPASSAKSRHHMRLLLGFSLNDHDAIMRASPPSEPWGPAASDMLIESRVRYYVDHGFERLPAGQEMDLGRCIPVLQAEIRDLLRQRADFDRLLELLWRYYKALHEHDRPVSHHLTVLAAKELVNFRQPKQAVTLLRAIDASPMAAKRPLDIAAMTVLLHAYVRLYDRGGVEWVRGRILDSNMRIDLLFVKHISRFRREVIKSPHRRKADIVQALESLQQATRTRRSEQRADNDAAGHAMVELFDSHLSGWDGGRVQRAGTRAGDGEAPGFIAVRHPVPGTAPATRYGFLDERQRTLAREIEVA